MNDTEEAARRLFAAASADIPPGIDLLDGVRARRAAHRARTRAALSIGTAGVLAAAGTTTLAAVRTPSALAQVTGAASRTAAQSYRVTSATEPPAGPLTTTGEFDPVRGTGEETTAQGFHLRFAGGHMYLATSGAVTNEQTHVRHVPPPGGRFWLKLPIPSWSDANALSLPIAIPGFITDLGRISPQNLLGVIESASHVREVGRTSGPGWTGVRYAFTAAKSLGPPKHLAISMTGTVDVDQHGRVRRLNATVTTTVFSPPPGQPRTAVTKVETTFSDFGLPVSVSVPPADEIITPTPLGRAPKPEAPASLKKAASHPTASPSRS